MPNTVSIVHRESYISIRPRGTSSNLLFHISDASCYGILSGGLHIARSYKIINGSHSPVHSDRICIKEAGAENLQPSVAVVFSFSFAASSTISDIYIISLPFVPASLSLSLFLSPSIEERGDMADEPLLTRWSFEDFEFNYDVKFGIKRAANQEDQERAIDWEGSSNGGVSSNGSVNNKRNGADLAIYEQFEHKDKKMEVQSRSISDRDDDVP